MDQPLLKTKLHIPKPRSSLVPRPRLIERLNDGAQRSLTLISAPPGFGKTTLVSEWIQSREISAAWLALDAGDNDPTRFFTYLIAAFQTIHADVGESILTMLRLPQLPPLESLLAPLLNDLANLSQDLTLVLDDYHVIENETIHDAFTFLLEHLPPQVQFIVATRADPPLPLARLRGRGNLLELRQTDLRFTPDEAAQFLKQVSGRELASQHVAALAARTEGWIAGLQMAAVSLQGRPDVAEFVAAFTGSQHYILDYLIEEVLQRQPAPVQSFLLETSILDRMCASLCDTVCTIGSSQTMLEKIEHANLLVVPLDDNQQWYRYHRLFADLLRARLHQTQAERVQELHRRASEWFEQNNLPTEAIDHALSAKDFERAAQLIEQNAEARLMQGEVRTFLKWMEPLPDERVRARPVLCLYHAAALLLAGKSGTQIRARLAEAAQANVEEQLSGGLLAFRGWLAGIRGDARAALELSQQALPLIAQDSAFLHSIVLASQGIAYLWLGDIPASFRAFEVCAQQGQRSGNLIIAIAALRRLAQLCEMQGRLHDAQAYCEQALDLARDARRELMPPATLALRELGKLAWERNDLDTASCYFAQSVELNQRAGILSASSQMYLALIREAQGDHSGALAMLGDLRQSTVSYDMIEWSDWAFALNEARLWLAFGDADAAARVLATRRASAQRAADADLAGDLLRRMEDLVQAQLALAQARPADALTLLDPWLAHAEQNGLGGYVIEVQVLRALAFYTQGNTAQAVAALERALTLAEPEGYARTFLAAGKEMRCLISDFGSTIEKRDDRHLRDYVDKLLAVFEATKGEGRKAKGALPVSVFHPPSLVEPLSAREIEVLQLLAAGLSNKAIANRLVIADETVKKHLKNVYGKLGTHSRTEAIARARELKLL